MIKLHTHTTLKSMVMFTICINHVKFTKMRQIFEQKQNKVTKNQMKK